MSNLQVITTQTPIGEFHMLVDTADVVRVSGFGSVTDLTLRLPSELRAAHMTTAETHPYKAYVQSYFAGDRNALQNIVYEQDGSEFQKQVWQAIENISHGETLSYKQLAQEAGNAPAIRAAGTICGLNKLILLVPCHRVLKSDGSIGSYLYGPEIKAFLLRHEEALI
jgi:methylated-DNA-[protein]-cysteine S-methyltransferase